MTAGPAASVTVQAFESLFPQKNVTPKMLIRQVVVILIPRYIW